MSGPRISTGADSMPLLCGNCAAEVPRTVGRGSHPKFCRSCYRARRVAGDRKRGWRRPNPEKAKARKARWYARNRDGERAKMLDRYYANAPARRAAARQWKRDNADRVKEYFIEWSKSHRDLRNLVGHVRRARLQSSAHARVTLSEWQRVFEEYRGICAYCPRTATEIDHIIPIARGGAHVAGNLVPACKSCNSSKGARSPLQWLISRSTYGAGVSR